jgi:hypothetical protein
MSLENLIKDLETEHYSKKKSYSHSTFLIKKIFYKIKIEDEFYNLFLSELEINFINYYKNIHKDKFNKKKIAEMVADNLAKNKFTINYIKKETIDQIKDIIKKEIKILENNEAENRVSRNELTISGGYKVIKLINFLNNELSKNGLLNSVSNYLQYDSEICGLAIELSSKKSTWWKHKKNTLENKTPAVHLDKDFNCIKSILYLSDVKSDNGPFTVYPKIYEDFKLNIFQDILGRIILETAGNIKDAKLKKYLDIKDSSQPFLSENFRKIYKQLPKKVAFNSHLGWELDAGSYLEKKIIDSKNEIHGDHGTLITFDGSRLLHSGGLVKEKNRLVLQIIYSKKINIITKYIKKIKNKLIN